MKKSLLMVALMAFPALGVFGDNRPVRTRPSQPEGVILAAPADGIRIASRPTNVRKSDGTVTPRKPENLLAPQALKPQSDSKPAIKPAPKPVAAPKPRPPEPKPAPTKPANPMQDAKDRFFAL